MNRLVRLAVSATAVGAVLVLLACAPIPWRRTTPTPGATPTRRIIQSSAETATARARGLGQGGGITSATATPGATAVMTEAADQHPTATSAPEATATAEDETGTGEGWRDALPAGESLLPSAPLSEGIADWDLWLQPGSSTPGTNKVLMDEDPEYGAVVTFSRRCDCNDGGAAGLMQVPEIAVSDWQHLYVWLVARVDSERGGNIANSDPRWFPEGAVQVRLKYTSASGEEVEWYHGFSYSDEPGADVEHFGGVGRGRWFSYLSDDLSELSPRPAVINEVRLYGFGWEFSGAVAEFAIVGSQELAQ